ncbi:hypothetical protein ACE939_11930 [Aquimarina sp. W85]|uniref:hypothetical protein n=1 Tax=Aquimarina rhodophyticola TaxID=3342246 RepID=UPI00366EA584
MSIYKINKKSIIKNLGFSFFIIIAFIITYIYFVYITKESDFIWLLSLILLGQLIPVILLLTDYFVNSTKEEIIVHGEYIEIKEKNHRKTIQKQEIEGLTIYASPSWYRNSTVKFFPFEAFHFVEIKLKNDNSIYITSLSDHNLYKNIQKEKLFKGLLYFYKGGITRQGNAINTIFWKKLD